MSLPRPSTFSWPASMAALTAARSPLMITATKPPPSFSLPTIWTLPALQAVSMASNTAVKPCVSMNPKANDSCFMAESSAAACATGSQLGKKTASCSRSGLKVGGDWMASQARPSGRGIMVATGRPPRRSATSRARARADCTADVGPRILVATPAWSFNSH